ncbi:MAG: hypothetical protein DRO09_01700 [Thermoprotei archaeon]|nr:MAG: hypothetical protein DRO09_01700 [Thermoprotei archaeon]
MITLPLDLYPAIRRIEGRHVVEKEGNMVIIRSDDEITIHYDPVFEKAINERLRSAEGKVVLGRGKVTIKPSYSIMFTLRLTKQQYEDLQRRAKQAGLKISDYARKLLFGSDEV